MHRDAATAAGAKLVQLAKRCGLIRGEWIAVDGSKFRAVSSTDTERERFQLQRYLDSMQMADQEATLAIDASAAELALKKLRAPPRRKLASC